MVLVAVLPQPQKKAVLVMGRHQAQEQGLLALQIREVARAVVVPLLVVFVEMVRQADLALSFSNTQSLYPQ